MNEYILLYTTRLSLTIIGATILYIYNMNIISGIFMKSNIWVKEIESLECQSMQTYLCGTGKFWIIFDRFTSFEEFANFKM